MLIASALNGCSYLAPQEMGFSYFLHVGKNVYVTESWVGPHLLGVVMAIEETHES
jgi:hypothetical protein